MLPNWEFDSGLFSDRKPIVGIPLKPNNFDKAWQQWSNYFGKSDTHWSENYTYVEVEKENRVIYVSKSGQNPEQEIITFICLKFRKKKLVVQKFCILWKTWKIAKKIVKYIEGWSRFLARLFSLVCFCYMISLEYIFWYHGVIKRITLLSWIKILHTGNST